jgi:hypothetical protein
MNIIISAKVNVCNGGVSCPPPKHRHPFPVGVLGASCNERGWGKRVRRRGLVNPSIVWGIPHPRPDRERERGRPPGSEIDESADRAGNSEFPRLSCRILKKGTASIDPVFGLQFQINSDFKEKRLQHLENPRFSACFVRSWLDGWRLHFFDYRRSRCEHLKFSDNWPSRSSGEVAREAEPVIS